MDYQIAMLKTRGSLGLIERLCVQSFLDAGHPVVLYTYGDIAGVPAEVELRDASDILPEAAMLTPNEPRAKALHADLFRYRLLAQARQTIWSETDAYCCRLLEPKDGYLLGWESEAHVGCGILCLPSDSDALTRLLAFTHDEYAIPPWEERAKRRAWRRARKAGAPIHASEHAWGIWGAEALTHFLRETGEIGQVLAQDRLYPFAFAERGALIDPKADQARLSEETLSIHLYGRRLLTEMGADGPEPDSLLGRLLAKHGVEPQTTAEVAPVPRRAHAASTGARAGFTPRREAPATGRAAEAQYRNLMDRVHRSQKMLEPLPNRPRSDRVTIVTSMKNEGCFILEWVAYHLSIGVTHFVVYTNDCDDPTNDLLDRLATKGIVTRIDNPFKRDTGQKPQRGALNDAIKLPQVAGADWVGVIDVDEFVNIHVGDGTFGALLHATNDPNVISMTWRFFGNRGIDAYEDRWQTEVFTACAPLYIPKPRLGWGFKSFFRPDGPFTKLGVHRPLDVKKRRKDEVRWVNGSGRVMPDRLVRKNEWFSRKDTLGYDMVTLNHYVLRSAESYLVKRQRGRVNHVDQDQGLSYWMNRNYATETDRSIQAHLPRAREELSKLLADETLFALHVASVDWHRSRIRELMHQSDYRALFKAITDPSLPDAIWRERTENPAPAAAE